MRIALVGPTHPIKGGVAAHTTTLAMRLAAAGHRVRIVSWARQYPARLYPGEQHVSGAPELPPFEPTERRLAWNSPAGWISAARRLRQVDLVVFAHITPVQVVPYLLMLAILRRSGVRTVVLSHNVLPHERSRVDRFLVGRLLRAPDLVLVHTQQQAAEARGLTDRPVVVAELAPFLPDAFTAGTPRPGEHRRLLFFGLVRPYKGLDVLLRALARSGADVGLRVVGEFWGGTEATMALVAELGLTDRVELRPGYAAAAEVAGFFADVDALVLPYRTATGSQAVSTAFQFGVPVIATRAGHLADAVRPGVDGEVAAPDDVDSLADAIRRFYAPGRPLALRAGVRPPDPDPAWHNYLKAIMTTPDPDPTPGTRPDQRRPRRRSARVGESTDGQQLEYSELQPLMLDEAHRRKKARKIIRVLERVLGPEGLAGRTAVDIGCSAGFISDELAARGAATTGLDIDVPGLAKARARFGDRVEFVCASGDDMPYADGSVDVVVLNHIYEHVPDPDAVLTEIHRVLADDGVAYLGLGNKHQLIEPHYRLPLLSWLPRTWADRYMRRAGRGDRYPETFSTRTGLKRMLRGFRVLDFTVPVVHRPEVYDSDDQVSRRLPRVPTWVARSALPIIPTFIWVAVKNDRVPAQTLGTDGLQVLDLRAVAR